jgi:hypothetical protein
VAPVGDDVIDDDDALAAGLPARTHHAKGAGNVPPPLLCRKPDLARRAPHPAEQEAIDWNAGQPPDGAGEQGRLIEAPRPEPRAVEGNRRDEIGVGEELSPGPASQRPNSGRPSCRSPYLKLWIRSRMIEE